MIVYYLGKEDIDNSSWLYYIKVHPEQTNFFNLWFSLVHFYAGGTL